MCQKLEDGLYTKNFIKSMHLEGLIELTEFVFEEVTGEVLSGFKNGKLVACPTCSAILDLIGQDLESDSDFYECANCGFKIKKGHLVLPFTNNLYL